MGTRKQNQLMCIHKEMDLMDHFDNKLNATNVGKV